jgi:hypothetical protein
MDDKKAESGLNASAQIIGSQKQVIWATVNTCIAFNSALLALLGAAKALSIIDNWLIISVSVLGAIATITWGLIINRHFAYYSYYYAWAREYEKHIHNDSNHMIQLGAKYSSGNEVTLPSNGAPIRMGWAARLFRIQWLIYLIMLSFLLLYVGLILKVI